jgi:hypothetical protein
LSEKEALGEKLNFCVEVLFICLVVYAIWN